MLVVEVVLLLAVTMAVLLLLSVVFILSFISIWWEGEEWSGVAIQVLLFKVPMLLLSLLLLFIRVIAATVLMLLLRMSSTIHIASSMRREEWEWALLALGVWRLLGAVGIRASGVTLGVGKWINKLCEIRTLRHNKLDDIGSIWLGNDHIRHIWHLKLGVAASLFARVLDKWHTKLSGVESTSAAITLLVVGVALVIVVVLSLIVIARVLSGFRAKARGSVMLGSVGANRLILHILLLLFREADQGLSGSLGSLVILVGFVDLFVFSRGLSFSVLGLLSLLGDIFLGISRSVVVILLLLLLLL